MNTIAYLTRWKEIQKEKSGETYVVQGDLTPVALQENGEIFDPRGFNRWFRDFCVKNGFGRYENTEQYWNPSGCHRRHKSSYTGLCFHELRHTQATLLIGNGCDIKTVQHRLGHADVETTLNTYSHAIDANDAAAADIIGKIQLS